MKRNVWFPVCRAFLVCLLLAVVALGLSGCKKEEAAMVSEPGAAVQTPALPDARRQAAEDRCAALAALIDGAADAAAAEHLLIDAGCCVIVQEDDAPEYVENAAAFYEFAARLARGEDAQLELLRVTEGKNLSYMRFACEDGTPRYSCMRYACSGGAGAAESFETHEILDWELTDRGNFYFQLYPAGDRHYADYSRLRLEKPDSALYAMTRRYILPVGYKAVNLFLCDWREGNFGVVSFNDLYDACYFLRCGEQADPDAYAAGEDGYSRQIPAEEFEAALMPYFPVSQGELQQLARYDAEEDCYPWKPFLTNDAVWYFFPFLEPEVTACRENKDGTLTLTVDVGSADLKTDRLFSHELTVRELDGGQFQYVGNRVTYQTAYGLPPDEARLDMAEQTYRSE